MFLPGTPCARDRECQVRRLPEHYIFDRYESVSVELSGRRVPSYMCAVAPPRVSIYAIRLGKV
jgi:hypothetical protein